MKLSRKILPLAISCIMGISVLFTGCNRTPGGTANNNAKDAFKGNKSETYYMVTFNSGIEYWKGCFKGFEAAGDNFGIKTVYTGGPQYDVNQEVTVLEQIIAKKPAGIAISAINPDALVEPIKKAMAAGIPIVTFDSDSPKSGRYSFLSTGNESAGVTAAKALGDQLKDDTKGNVIIITQPGQLNEDERAEGFKKELAKDYKGLKVVAVGNGKGDQTTAANVTSGFLQANSNVKGIFCTDATGGVGVATAVKEAKLAGKIKVISFDTDKGTLDGIKGGTISATIAQGTYNMGYWSLNDLFQLHHNLVNPINNWKQKNVNPLPPTVDTGVNIVTKENVESFYVK